VSDFNTWVAQEKAANAQIIADVGPYERVYFPEPKHRAG